MDRLKESVVASMDGADLDLYEFLPYIMQDIWEIGSDPQVICHLVEKNFTAYKRLRVLDLGCGKGAVSIKLAKRLGCQCLGIDAVSEFIEDAKKKAKEHKADELCTFEVGDIRECMNEQSGYDVIILGSIGPVLGNHYQTLLTLSNCLKVSGIFIIDDAYIEDSSNYSHPLIYRHSAIMQQITAAGMQLIDEYIISKEDIKTSNDYIFTRIKKRCQELMDRFPFRKQLFNNYIRQQEIENEVLENELVCSTVVIGRMKY